jgi:hypothetical protein
VYVVRDPIERIKSQYLHAAHRRGRALPIDDSIRANPALVEFSRYRFQIDQYLECFDVSQLLVLTSESLRDDRARVLGDVFRFIGVDPSHVPEGLDTEKNRTSQKYVATEAASRIRRVPGFDAVSRRAPLGLKKAVGRLTFTPVSARIDTTISDGLLAELRDVFRADVIGLRPFLGADFDGWGLLDE